MNNNDNDLSRTSRKQNRQKENVFLNVLIGIVVIAIIITTTIIIKSSSTNSTEQVEQKENEQIEENIENKKPNEDEPTVTEEPDTQESEDVADVEDPGKVTHIPSDDPNVSESIVNTAWEPIATQQEGEHVSSFDGKSVDWLEKKEAIAYAVEMSQDALIYWKVKNGGNSSKAIGIISSKDQADKYRVFIEWVDGQGWKPVKVDVLTTLDI